MISIKKLIFSIDSVNLISLMLIQGANAVLPLIIFPYVLSAVGAVVYSKIAIAESISLIVVSVVLYSFDINGVSKVVTAIERNDIDSLSSVFSNIFYTRIILWMSCFGLFSLLAPVINNKIYNLTLIWMLVPLGYAFQSAYYYLGAERNEPLAVFTLIFRALAVLCTILFVKNPADCYRVSFIIGGTYFASGLMAFVFLVKCYNLKLKKLNVKDVGSFLREGKEIFLGNISVLFYRNFNIIILGLLKINPTIISAYSIVNKLINSLQAIVRPLNQFFYPKALKKLKLYNRPSRQSFLLLLRLTLPQELIVIAVLCFCFLIFFLSTHLHRLASSFPGFELMAGYFMIMFSAVLFGIANFMFGTVGLNNLHCQKRYAVALMITGISNILTGFFLIFLFGGIGAPVNFILGELMLFILIMMIFLKIDHKAYVTVGQQ